MKRDFTLHVYLKILETALEEHYAFIPFVDYLGNKKDYKKVIILRHDVDRKPVRALAMAQMEQELSIKASYYFRIVKRSFNERIIKEIIRLGHEIGYHYEDLSMSGGNFLEAISRFKNNLEKFGKICPVKTICMHGSPLSTWNNALLWTKYKYQDYGIIGDPLFDLDFDEFLYLTDTGRRWNHTNANIRDKVSTKFEDRFKNSFDIIEALKKGKLPVKIALNVHPNRWNNDIAAWTRELVFQNFKNIIKKFLLYTRYHGQNTRS
jgi:hypothetical protein